MQHLGKVVFSLTFFQEVKMNILKRDFSFATWHQGKECATISIASTVKSFLGTMQKHQELVSSGYLKQIMLRTHPRPHHFLIYRCFLTDPMMSSVGNEVNGLKATHIENLHSSVKSGENLRSIGRQMRPRVILYVRGQKILFLKMSRGCHFGSDGPIDIMLLFFCTSFCFALFSFFF